MEKIIDLEEIIIKQYGCTDIEDLKRYFLDFISITMTKECMRAACEQTVVLCAENHKKWYNDKKGNDNRTPTEVILNTKTQIK